MVNFLSIEVLGIFFCKRYCDYLGDNNIISLYHIACRVCSCVEPTIYDEDQIFKDILIDERNFTEKFCEFFGAKSIFSLDIWLLYTSFVDVVTARNQKCLYFNAKKNPKNVFKEFLSILVRVYLCSFFPICDEYTLGKTTNVISFRKSFRKFVWNFC